MNDSPIIRHTEATEWSGALATISLTLPSGRTISVDASGPYRSMGALHPATVNWPGIGSVSPDDAADFGELLSYAASVARVLPGPTEES